MTQYVCELTPLSTDDPKVRAISFSVQEYRGGWRGEAEVSPPPPEDSAILSFWNVADAPFTAGFTPGNAMALAMVVGGGADNEGEVVRTWPAVVTNVNIGQDWRTGAVIYRVRFSDPLSYLSSQPVWGAFQENSPAEILGGAMSLAAGGSGVPSLTPELSGLPGVRLSARLRPSTAKIPFAIAAGERLGFWLRRLLGRLGARIESRVGDDGQIEMILRDGNPSDDPLPIFFEAPGGPGPANAVLRDLDAFGAPAERASLLDNLAIGDARMFGASGAVEQVISAAEVGADEAGVRAGFRADAWEVAQRALMVESEVHLARPEARLGFINASVDSQRIWQVSEAMHNCRDGLYRNFLWLQKDGDPWRLPIPEDDGPIAISGVVDDGVSAADESVVRDRVGRIPVRPVILPRQAEDKPGETRLSLPVLAPLGGGMHGFLSAHRQGDACRILVHHPFFAEVVGFGYRDDRRVGADFSDASTGLTIRHGSDGWAGLLFRPKDDVKEQLGIDSE